MKLSLQSVLTLASGVALGGTANYPTNNNGLTVKTHTGAYTGMIDAAYPRTRQFRAIPFAEPPVVARRFLPPQKLARSSEHHYTTRFPPSCPQFVMQTPMIYNTRYTKGNLIFNGNQNDTSGLSADSASEDCLFLAVWAPTKVPAAGLPVAFFMTGGGNILGGVDIPWQYGAEWVERSQAHIVVSINYRLNILGFPNARGLPFDQQNLGIMDQRIALEWVRDNIAAFGGDPTRIMMWGQSSGAVDSDIHSYAYPQDPIAQSYFMQSGVVLTNTVSPRDRTFSNFTFVARHVGCAIDFADPDGAAELDCMRHVPFSMLQNFIGQYGDAGTKPLLYFNKQADNKTVYQNYTTPAAALHFARRPVMLSVAANEAAGGAWPLANLTAGPWQPPITAVDLQFVCSTYNTTVYRNRAHVPVFRMQYAGTYPNLNHFKWLGAYHASDLPIIFGTYHQLDGVAPTTDFEVQVSRAYQDRVLAFLQDPYHGPQKLGWLPQVASDPKGGYILRLGADGKVAQGVNGMDVDGACEGKGEYNPFP